MDFRFSILGQTRLRIGDRFDDQWGQPKLRGILAVLLLHPRQAIPVDTIVAWVWPDGEGPGNPAATLHKYSGRIRDALNRMDPRPRLRCRNGAYRIEVDREEIDYFRFRAAVEHARQAGATGDHEHAYRTMERALAMWTDQPFADLHGDNGVNRRVRANTDLWLPAYDTLLRELSALGRFEGVLRWLDDLPVDHATHLTLASHRLTALYGLSRHKEAVSYVHHARKLLRDNDELDEANELLRLHDELRDQGASRPSTVVRQDAVRQYQRHTPHMLPHDIVDFVGRTDLLADLDAKTTTPSGEPASTVVILDGPPGVGKTALATRWAHQVRHRFPGGELFSNLDGFSDRTRRDHLTVVDDFLIALGHPPAKDESSRLREQMLSRLLAEQPTLVVLDNAYNTAQVRDLVQLLTGCLVLVTSRQRLRTLASLVGARRVTVEPMRAPEATALLTAQLGAQRSIADDDRARLVQRCGGLPVAITVLTAHLATSPTAPLTEFATRLTPRQLVVELGEHGDGEVNVGTLFAQSYDALAEPERRLFRLLGLHPGPDVSVAAAAACVDSSTPDTTRSLAALVSAHLLEQPDTFDRYRFHDLLAEFAAHCAESREPAESRHLARRRVVGYYLASAIAAVQTLYPSYLSPPRHEDEPAVLAATFADSAQAQTWLHLERPNLTAAVSYAADHGHHDLAWRLVDAVATCFDRFGYNEESRAVREVAVGSARAAGDRGGEVSSLVGLGMVHTRLGDHVSARQCLEEALRLATEDEFDRGMASALHQLGRLEVMVGDPVTALEVFRRGLAIADRTDDYEGLCWYHYRIAQVLHATDQHVEALVSLHDARRFAQRIGEDSAQAGILIGLGSIYRDRGDYRAADAHLEQARTIAAAIPDLAATAQACIELAELHNTLRHNDGALRYAEQAVTMCQQTNNRVDEARALAVLGSVHLAGGDPDKAEMTWRQAVSRYLLIGNSARASLFQAKIDDMALSQSVTVPIARTENAARDGAVSDVHVADGRRDHPRV